MHLMKPKPNVPQKSKPKPGAMKTDWQPVADWYDAHVGDAGGEYHREVVLPGTTRLMQLNPGDTALDVACGQGVLCRWLASRGVACTGVDAAADLIRAAKARGVDESVPKELTPTYLVMDAAQLERLPTDQFHAAACVLAIQNMHPIAPVFVGIARTLRDRGRLVIVMMHPCFRGPKETHWGWDEAANVQYRRVDRYLLPRKSPIVTNPGSAPGVYTWSFHKPIGAYVKALRQAGLLVDAIEEWPSHKTSTSGPKAAAENRAREEIPMFLAIRAVKVSGLDAAGV